MTDNVLMPSGDEAIVASPDELFIGFVRAIGTDLEPIVGQVTTLLRESCGYRIESIKLSTLLAKVPGAQLAAQADQDKYQYYRSRMDAGDKARQISFNYVALLAIEEILERRKKVTSVVGTRRVAWMLDSLMHPDEVATFRSVYGQHFLLIAVYEEPDLRRQNLCEKLSLSAQIECRDVADLARELIKRDRGTPLDKAAVAIGDTFHLADVFVDVADPASNREVVSRVSRQRDGVYTSDEAIAPVGLTNWTIRAMFEQVFGVRNFTPTRHEQAMAHAFTASMASGSLARRVGAVLTSTEGEILATGVNDVPARGGGQYPVFDHGTGQRIDARDYSFLPHIENLREGAKPGYGYDANDFIKFDIFLEVADSDRHTIAKAWLESIRR